MAVKLAIAAALALAFAVGSGRLLWGWWRQAERELDAQTAQIEAQRAADDAGREAVRGFADVERGAREEREKAEQALGNLAGAADDDFWLGLERLLDDDTDADARRSAAGVSADAVRGGRD